MRIRRVKNPILLVLVVAAIGAVGSAAVSSWTAYREQRSFNRAVNLSQSSDATERRLALSLLVQMPRHDDVIRLIGVGLFDTDLANRLYAIQCLTTLIGDVVPLPPGATVQPTSAVLHSTLPQDSRTVCVKFSDQACQAYVDSWQEWFRKEFSVHASGRIVVNRL